MTVIGDDGYCVLRGLLDAPTVAMASASLSAILDDEAGIAVERGWATDTHRVSYALPVKDPLFLDLCCRPAIIDVVRSELGDDAILAGANGMDVPPGGPAQALHRDHPTPTGTTLYLHVVVALDPFRPERGATRVVGGSHRGELATWDRQRVGDLEGRAVSPSLEPGDGVAFDGALVHAAGANATQHRRRALHLFYCRPWVQPHWDFPAMLTPEEASGLSDEQRQVLGVGRVGPRRFDRDERRIVR